MQDLKSFSFSHSSPIVQKAFLQEEKFRACVAEELNWLLEQIKFYKIPQKKETYQNKVLGNLKRDIRLAKTLNKALISLDASKEISWSLKTNKLEEILSYASRFLKENVGLFETLLEGRLPKGVSLSCKEPTILGSHNNIFGNATGSPLKYLILSLWAVVCALDEQTPSVLSSLQKLEKCYIDRSYLIHFVPLPQEIRKILEQEHADCKESILFHESERSELALACPHNGYAFGGCREEERYSFRKESDPEDCSSSVAKWIGCNPNYFSTEALYILHLRSRLDRAHGFSLELEDESISKILTSVDIASFEYSPEKTFIYAHRSFNDVFRKLGEIGAGGHVALIIAEPKDGRVQTIGCARDLSDGVDGFGLLSFSLKEDPLKEKMIFEINFDELKNSEYSQSLK